MSTKSKNDFLDLLKFDNEQDKFRHDAEMIMFKFLSEVEKIMKQDKTSRRELAEKIGTSASYITQLFRGHKLLNLLTIAKIQEALNITFKIRAYDKNGHRISKHDIQRFLEHRHEKYPSYGDRVTPEYGKSIIKINPIGYTDLIAS